jgi:hypothetical protein
MQKAVGPVVTAVISRIKDLCGGNQRLAKTERRMDSRILAFGNIRALVFGLSRQPQVTAANNRPFFYLYAIGGHGKAVSGGLPWVFSFLHLCL